MSALCLTGIEGERQRTTALGGEPQRLVVAREGFAHPAGWFGHDQTRVGSAMTNPAIAAVQSATSPSRGHAAERRLAAVIGGSAAIWAASALIVRALHKLGSGPPIAALHVAVAPVLGAVAMLLACSIVEWLVHGKLMHRRSRWPFMHLAYDLHHRAHHRIHYPPDAYVQDEVTYVPLVPPRPERACRTAAETAAAALGQALFYAS